MKSIINIYEGILDDIDTGVNRMDQDLEKMKVYEWLEYHATSKDGFYRYIGSDKHDGLRVSTQDQWNLKFNSDGSVDILSNITLVANINASDYQKQFAGQIPFKIHKVHGIFKVGSHKLIDTKNFPDIADSVEFSKGIKIRIHDWHIKLENKQESRFGYYLHPFNDYNKSHIKPCIDIPAGPVIGKNVVIECLRTNHDRSNRPWVLINNLTTARLKNITFINIPHIIISEARAKIPTWAELKTYDSHIKDTKLISSTQYELCNKYIKTDKVGLFIRMDNNEFIKCADAINTYKIDAYQEEFKQFL